MNREEEMITRAFDALVTPPGLKEATMATIEQTARETHDEGFFADDMQSQVKSSKPQISVIRRSGRNAKRRTAFALAACLLIAVIGFGSYGAYADETAVVGIDVNPSIELGVNRFDIVVSARAINEDGQALLESIDVVNMSYEDALVALSESDASKLDPATDPFVAVNVVCDNEQQANTLLNLSQSYLSNKGINCVCNRASQQVHEQAGDAGMGIGRYEAAMTLMKLDPTVTIDECRSMSMKELGNRIADLDPDSEYAHARSNAMGDNASRGQGHGGDEESPGTQNQHDGNASGMIGGRTDSGNAQNSGSSDGTGIKGSGGTGNGAGKNQ